MKKTVYIIPGWNSRGRDFTDVAAIVARMVRRSFNCDCAVETLIWERCDAPFGVACEFAREYVGEFALRLYEAPKEERENAIMFAHSLGAVVLLKTLASLQSVGMKIEHATLLGAAIPCDSNEILLASQAVKYQMWNVSNEQDAALGIGYVFAEDRVPLGVCSTSPFFKNVALDKPFDECFFGHAFCGYLKAIEYLYTYGNITGDGQ